MESLFEQFEGADLDRLVACLQAIKDAGMRVDRHTQAGVNQNSGNVWVGPRIGRGVCIAPSGSMSHGAIPAPSVAKNTILRLTPRWRSAPSACKACKPKFVAGWNMPGYLPDADPVEFDDAEEALEYVRDLMREDAEGMGWSREDAEAIDTIESDKAGEFGATMYGKHYFVTLEA